MSAVVCFTVAGRVVRAVSICLRILLPKSNCIQRAPIILFCFAPIIVFARCRGKPRECMLVNEIGLTRDASKSIFQGVLEYRRVCNIRSNEYEHH